MLFPEFIKTKRIAARLTLREFCRQLEIDPSNWSKVERGVAPPPQEAGFWEKLSSLLNFTPDMEGEAKDLAALSRGQLPADIQGSEILAKMPIFFRAVRGQEYSEADLKELLEGVKRLHQPGS